MKTIQLNNQFQITFVNYSMVYQLWWEDYQGIFQKIYEDESLDEVQFYLVTEKLEQPVTQYREYRVHTNALGFVKNVQIFKGE